MSSISEENQITITIEGGYGKTTLLNFIGHALKEAGVNVRCIDFKIYQSDDGAVEIEPHAVHESFFNDPEKEVLIKVVDIDERQQVSDRLVRLELTAKSCLVTWE